MRPARLYLEIGLVSLGAVLLEVSYTRVFSFKLVYYFTYFIIGIALLGLGSGAVLVTLAPRLRRMDPARLIPACCVAAALGVLTSYVIVARTPLNAFDLIKSLHPFVRDVVVAEGTKLAAVCFSVFVPFLAAGIAVAAIFATQSARIGRLYFADLVGAATGCALAVPLMSAISPPGSVILAGAVFAIAAIPLVARHRPGRLATVVPLAAALLVGAAFPGRLPDPVPDRAKGLRPTDQGGPLVLFTRWSPVFRVDVSPSPYEPEGRRLIYHDAMIGSVLRRFDGDLTSLAAFDSDQRSLPFTLLGREPAVAIIGAAGGHDVLAALYFGAGHVTAIELNPVTVSLLTDEFADYTGHLATHPRITLVNAEGRTFLERDRTRYDLIWFVAPDSYAAMNAATSGAFVLSESYLYTQEMIASALEHLSPQGMICAQFGEVAFDEKPNRTLRYVGTARAAFRRLGIDDVGRHVLVSTARGLFTTSTVLLRRTPFSDEDVARYAAQVGHVPKSRIRYVPGEADVDERIRTVLTAPEAELEAWYARNPFDLRPVTDDAPFFWHFVRLRDAVRVGSRGEVGEIEEGTGERLLLLLLAVATVFAATFLLAPLALARDVWRRIPHKGSACVYFAAIGTGFMLLEITLIQRLTLLLGYPTHSLTVTLFALLVFTGCGSLLSERYRGRRNAAVACLVGALALLVLFYELALGPIVDRCVGWSFAARVALALGVLAPLGVCLGGFMPLGLRSVAGVTDHPEEFVAWSWAVNGFCSVVSSVLATILAMTLGFGTVLLLALGAYVAGVVALLRIPAPSA